jgi:prepilin-type N-terminal cleavage/methylation domain-containing protein
MSRKILSYINNNRGITLIELLAALVIFSIISSILYNVLFSGMNQFIRINSDTLIRDEADITMTQFMNHLYLAKKAENITIPNGSMVKIIKATGEEVTLGFVDTQVMINGENILSSRFYQNGSEINYNSATHTITITLKIKHQDATLSTPLELNSRIQLINLSN